MAKIVVDSSVVIKWFEVETYSTKAREVLQAYVDGDLDLLAPDLLSAELGNIVWKKQRFQGLSAIDAQFIIDAFQTLNISFTANSILLSEAYQLAVAYQRTVYDSLYLALSIREQCKFVTADEAFVNAIGNSMPYAVSLVHWSL